MAGAEPDSDRITVARAGGVTTWPAGDRVHVVRDKQDVFVLGDGAARAWRSVVFGRPLRSVLAAAEASGAPQAGPLIAQFLRFGLVKAAWKGEGPIVPAMPLAALPAPSHRRRAPRDPSSPWAGRRPAVSGPSISYPCPHAGSAPRP
ncbi:hypothetical protein ACFQ2Y_44765 [Streptomyces malaysiensis subsp. malaysiensis]